MRNVLIASAMLFAAWTPIANAQSSWGTYNPYGSKERLGDNNNNRPRSGSTYDYNNNSSDHWRTDRSGNSTVNGYNYNNGISWTNRTDSRGNQSGIDSRGNSWNYNAASGFYSNSNGKVCSGRGAARVCN
jgi:hypothetical protein